MSMLQVIETTEWQIQATLKAFREHADMAAQASRRARTPEDRIAHAQVEKALRDAADSYVAGAGPVVIDGVEYHPIPGHLDYLISRRGNIWSTKRACVLAQFPNTNGYLSVKVSGKNALVHRLLARTFFGPIPEDRVVDHIDGCKTNNCLENLRLCTQQQNSFNSRSSAGKSKFKGVTSEYGKWSAYIKWNGKSIRLGRFDTEEDAARAYDFKAREIFGEYANTNFAGEEVPA